MMRRVPAIMVAGSRSGVGKTTVASCLIALLREAGYRVRPFKLGPDYIDAGRHAAVAGEDCINLDPFLLVPPGREADSGPILARRFRAALAGFDAAVIEAVGGLHDDWRSDGSSPAATAALLGVPVLIVHDARASCQTAGIEVAALAEADPALAVAGFAFPEVSTDEHLDRITRGIPARLRSLPAMKLPYSAALRVEERHLGLITAAEGRIDAGALAAAARGHLDLDRILARAAMIDVDDEANGLADNPGRSSHASAAGRRPFTLALAFDEAFSFYYPDNLAALRDAGARIVPFSPLRDASIPAADLTIFGGGFPELHAESLESNRAMRDSVAAAAAGGMPMYAECGGLMYLSRRFSAPDGGLYDGAGVLPFTVRFGPLVLRYLEVETIADCVLGPTGARARAHEFHRSFIEDDRGVPRDGGTARALSLREPGSAVAQTEGYKLGGLLATWAHIHFASSPAMPAALASAALAYRAAAGREESPASFRS